MQYFLIKLVIFASVFVIEFAQAANKSCIPPGGPPPCDGKRGKCYTNPDGSQGGFVANTANVKGKWLGLHSSKVYIAQYASVCDSATVSDNAILLDSAKVGGKAKVSGNAKISGHASVFDKAHVSDRSQVSDHAQVSGTAEVKGDSKLSGHAQVSGQVEVTDSEVSENAEVSAQLQTLGWETPKKSKKAKDRAKAIVYKSRISDDAKVGGYVSISDSQISGKAEIGGLIGSDSWYYNKVLKVVNNSHVSGSAYVSGEAFITNSHISGSAKVSDRAQVKTAQVSDYAEVSGYARVTESQIRDHAKVWGEVTVSRSQILEHATVSGHAVVADNSEVSGYAKVYGYGTIDPLNISGHAKVSGNAEVEEQAQIYNHSQVLGSAKVSGRATISKHSQVSGSARISEQAEVENHSQVSGTAQVLGLAQVLDGTQLSGDEVVQGRTTIRGNRVTRAENATTREDWDPLEYYSPLGYNPIANAPFRPFIGSDAQELQKAWTRHLLNPSAYKDRCGELDIKTPPNPRVDYWVFKAHAKLPCALKEYVGIKFKQVDITSHALAEELGLALMEPDAYDHHQGDINPDFDLKKTSEAEQKYIKQLHETLSDIITKLNNDKGQTVTDSAGRQSRYFANNLGQTANTYYGTGTLHINTHPRDTKQFKELLNAIEENDEPKFIQQMIRLSTTFDQKHAQAKSGFIDVMTHLFVTKEFPSKGAKTSYLHIILRCGGFSSGRD